MIGSGAQVLFLNVHHYIAPGPLASLNLSFPIRKTRELDQVSASFQQGENSHNHFYPMIHMIRLEIHPYSWNAVHSESVGNKDTGYAAALQEEGL